MKIKTVFFLFMVLFLSCNSNSPLYNVYQTVDNQSWNKNKTFYFTFNIEDSKQNYDITFHLRHSDIYPYGNIWLFTYKEDPIGNLKKDTIQSLLTDKNGKWIGNGISLFQTAISFKKNYKFERPGQYTIALKHAMRDSILNGVKEIGLTLEKSQ